VTAALALDARAWDLAADAVAVHRAHEGHLDRVAVRPPVWVVAGDPSAPGGGSAGRSGGGEGRELGPDRPSVRVFPDEAALLDALAAAAVATLAPLLREVRAATRFGLVPLWNGAGDAVRLTAEMVPRYAGRAPRPGLAPVLLDALVAHGALIRGRGEDQPLPGRSERVPVRAACCLAFRTDPPVATPSDALCTTCPLLTAPERARRYTAFLDGLRPR